MSFQYRNVRPQKPKLIYQIASCAGKSEADRNSCVTYEKWFKISGRRSQLLDTAMKFYWSARPAIDDWCPILTETATRVYFWQIGEGEQVVQAAIPRICHQRRLIWSAFQRPASPCRNFEIQILHPFFIPRLYGISLCFLSVVLWHRR